METGTTKPKKKVLKRKTRKRKPPQEKPREEANGSHYEEARPSDDDLYPEVHVQTENGKVITLLTREQAQQLLGWTNEPKDGKWKEWLLKDLNGAKIKCHANEHNRPLYLSNVEALKQEILRRKWIFNGEPIIIGKQTGRVLNGQHTLVALVLACQEWDKHPGKWIEWQEEPHIHKLVIFGVDEGDATVNTMDTCKPRSLADVIYRSEFFANTPPKDRKLVARICSYAINTLWERMGAQHAFAPRQTHSEALDFLDKHPRVLEAVNHVTMENGGDNTIGKYLSLGYAAGMMYLMGCSTTDPKEYISNPCEAALDFSNWDKAEEFIVLVGNQAKEVVGLRTALKQLLAQEEGGSRQERLALFCSAWLQFVAKGKVGPIKLRYEVVDDVKHLKEPPSVGGIDLVSFSRDEVE